MWAAPAFLYRLVILKWDESQLSSSCFLSVDATVKQAKPVFSKLLLPVCVMLQFDRLWEKILKTFIVFCFIFVYYIYIILPVSPPSTAPAPHVPLLVLKFMTSLSV